MPSISTQQPRIACYWIGWQKNEFDPGQPLPAYLEYVDVLIMAFSLVKNGEMTVTCVEDETCLCNGPNYFNQPELQEWIMTIKKAYPNIKVTMSVGGWAFNDWASVTDVSVFVTSIVKNLLTWNGAFDGVDIDYETGASTGLPGYISFHDIIKELISQLENSLSVNPVLSLPYYGGSPWGTADLQDLANSITFVSSMGYNWDTYGYQTLLSAGYRANCGFDNPMLPPQIPAFVKNNDIKAAMFWNLNDDSEGPPANTVMALNSSLP